jgi:nucleoside-diphosphate-sugar epimerase
MQILVVGASGATGRLLVEQLLSRGHSVIAIVRSEESLPELIRNHENLSLICATLLDMGDTEIRQYVRECDAVASCLGHHMSMRGIFGPPYRLVKEATCQLCHAIHATRPDVITKFVLMNSVGNRNRDLQEEISLAQQWVIWLLRLLIPPHIDNEEAADYLRVQIGQDDRTIEWVAVRPDTLVDQTETTEYEVYTSPTRSAIFNPGSTSRINVAHFMANLITNENIWNQWKGQMPVIYNKESTSR